jgi:GTP-binding protein
MTFVDEASLQVRSGAGGNGSASFHSEPFKPKGGPNGGDGGRGGSVILEVSSRSRDLSWLADHPHQRAEAGKPGARNNRHGADGKDLVVAVPDGTVVRDERGFVADLVGEGKRIEVARGGRGGRGNAVLAGPKNRAPRSGEPGEPAEEHILQLELRTIADVGLVGLPSAGKSTLLAALTAAQPKIAAYPFTTLSPNLGVSEGEGKQRFVVADVPGLIEGASEGRGLGLQFLRHVSRCPVIACVVDSAADDPAEDARTVFDEIAAYDPALAGRMRIVLATKTDLIDDEEREVVESVLEQFGPVVSVSGETGRGTETLASRLGELIATAPPPFAAETLSGAPSDRRDAVVLRPGRAEFVIEREAGAFRVNGRKIERLVAGADLEDPRSVADLQRKLVKEGVEKALAAAGARRGDDVMIGAKVFEFIPEEDG